MSACKRKCSGCWALTYYAGLQTAFAKQCYIFLSEAECGTLMNYRDMQDAWVEEKDFAVTISLEDDASKDLVEYGYNELDVCPAPPSPAPLRPAPCSHATL